MQRSIALVPQPPRLEQKKRVAAYARVSSGKDAMLHSLSSQVSHYSTLIQENNQWLYAGVYADEAQTGTKESRPGFQQLLADCRAGKIDLVITKSISRFARNTVTLLATVRELKSLGVDIYFEEQNLHTMSSDGELMLSILASYAQEESLSVSENQKWRVKKNFENGMPWNSTLLGYRYMDGKYVVVPREAETVKYIFSEYLSGVGCPTIAKHLNEAGIPTRFGNEWQHSSVRRILLNYSYTGNLLLQTTFSENHLTKRMLPNHGERPMYHVEDTHEAIIDLDTFHAVQKLMAQKSDRLPSKGRSKPSYPFSGLLVCACCGKNYRRRNAKLGKIWICGTLSDHGKAACPSKQIPESTLEAVTREVLGLEEITAAALHEQLTSIRVENGNRLVYCLTDGTEIVKEWADRSRRESWTPEMRAVAAQRLEQRSKNLCQK